MSAFYIPRGAKEIVLKAERPIDEELKPQIYVVDAEEMSAVKEKLCRRRAEILIFEDARVKLKVEGRRGEKLFTSLPFDKGWTVELNGRSVEPKLMADCLTGFELVDGENIIEMEYNLPGLKLGALITVLSLMILVWYRKEKA